MPVLWTRWNAHTTGWQTRFLLNGISSGNVAVAKCFHFSCYENALVHRLCSPHPPKCCSYHSRVQSGFCSLCSFKLLPHQLKSALGMHKQERWKDANYSVEKFADVQVLFFFFLIKQLLFFLLLAQRLDSYWQMMQLQKGLSLTYTWMFKVANVTCLNTKLWSS